jgi:hypothetical protein
MDFARRISFDVFKGPVPNKEIFSACNSDKCVNSDHLLVVQREFTPGCITEEDISRMREWGEAVAEDCIGSFSRVYCTSEDVIRELLKHGAAQ